MAKKHSWSHLPHPGPDPEITRTLREIFEKVGNGVLLQISHGRLATKATPRSKVELADELAEILVHTEVFKRTWWSLPLDKRDLVWRLLDPLYRDGGWTKYEDLKDKPSHQDLAAFETAGLLFPLPSALHPEYIALPYEYFFMPDMPGTGPQSLCQGLRHYSDAGARVLASELGLRGSHPRASALALLHRRLIQTGKDLSTNLAPGAAALLEHVALRGGVISAKALADRLAATRPDWVLRLPLMADDLVGARFNPNSAANLLARRGLLVPCGEPGWSAFPQVAVPTELREDVCGPALSRSRAALRSERRRLALKLPEAHPDARPGQFAADLRRFALVVHIEHMVAGKGGKTGRSERKRLEHLLHIGSEELEGLLEFAARRGGEAEPLGGAGLEAFLALPEPQQILELAEDYLGPAGWLHEFRRHLVTVLAGTGESYAGLDALARHLAKDPVVVGAYEACHAGELGPSEEEWVRGRVSSDLRALHRLGFAERASGAPQEAYRFATATAWAFTSKKPPATASHAPRSTPPAESGFAVLPTLEILAPPSGGIALLTALARIARLDRADAAFVFRVDKKSLAAGINSGMTTPEIREFLEKHSRNPLPETVRFLLTDLEGGAAQVTWDTKAGLLRAPDPMVLLRLKRVRWLRPWLIEGAPEGALRITPEADGTELAQRLAKEGFVIAQK